MVGGLSALAGAIAIGPRIGRFDADGRVRSLHRCPVRAVLDVGTVSVCAPACKAAEAACFDSRARKAWERLLACVHEERSATPPCPCLSGLVAFSNDESRKCAHKQEVR